MSAFCLDTNAYIALRRGEPAIGRQIESARWIGVSTIVLGELGGGFLNGSLLEFNRRRLNNFLEEPVVEILSVDRKVADRYGEIYFHLRKSGRPIPQNDMWIAAIAIAARVPLVTYDRHFDRVPDLVTLAPV